VQKRVVGLLDSRLATVAIPPGLCLDVGTGTGALAAAMLKRVAGQLVVMDIAHGMTRAAAERLPDGEACDGDARQLPFSDQTFACVVSSSVYQWIECLPSAFAEVSRVLRPGGLFALALFGERTLCELRSSHRQAVAESGTGQASHVQNFPTLGEVAEAITGAGLACDDLYKGMEVEYHLDVPDLLRQLKKIGASNATADRPRGLASRRVIQSMIKSYEEQYRCESGLPASYEVIIVVARKDGIWNSTIEK
jgi:malonyl-CoA O-methyltransferase